MRQLTGAKIMPVVGREMLSRGPFGTRDTPRQTGIYGPLRARALLMFGPLVQKWCDQGFLCGYRRQAPGSLGIHGRPLPGSWSCLEMLSDLSTELKGLGFSLFTKMGKCAWMGIGIDELAPVYFEREPRHQSQQLLCLGVHRHQRIRCFSDSAAQNDFGFGSVLKSEGPAAITGLHDEITIGSASPGSHPDAGQSDSSTAPWSNA